MTPTLNGRWQTRFLLLITVGLFITFFFVLQYASPVPYYLLAAVFFIGLLWDILYDYVQRWRWDRDWPPILQLSAGIVEGLFLFALIRAAGFTTPTTTQFWLHYGTVWIGVFCTSQSITRILFPRWRFYGGEWL